MLEFDQGDMFALERYLGSDLGDLVQVMLDLDTIPLRLFADDGGRLLEVRERVLGVLNEWVGLHAAQAEAMYSRLPQHIRSPAIPEALLEAVTWICLDRQVAETLDQPSFQSRVFSAAPALLPLLDESGLVSLEGLDARPGGLHFGDYAFHYHQLLRRGFSSAMHTDLVATVLALAATHGLKARIALDDRRLRFITECRDYVERDRWFGRTLSEEELDDLAVVGETFYGDPAGGESILMPYAGLSIRWTSDGDFKTVEIEEFMPSPHEGAVWVLARYLHARRDTSKRVFVHCDGAVKAYAATTYPRVASGFRHRGKGDRYRKLFRVDGEFPSSAWSAIATSWFRGNKLIWEYFGPTREVVGSD